MCYFLRRKRPEFPRLVKSYITQRCPRILTDVYRISHLIDALTLYTIENGLLTWYEASLLGITSRSHSIRTSAMQRRSITITLFRMCVLCI